MIELGTVLARREPRGDDHDRLTVVGRLELGYGPAEIILSPTDAFGAAFSADERDVLDVYAVDTPGRPPVTWGDVVEGAEHVR